MRIMIVDDEQPCIDELVYLLARYTDVAVSGTFTNPLKALEGVRASDLDAVFVDVSMPYMSGIELADSLKKLNNEIQIIFVTAHSRLLDEIKRVRPALYVLKPVSEIKLNMIVEHLRKYLSS